MGHSVDNAIVENNLTTTSWSPSLVSVPTTLNGTTTLTNLSAFTQEFTGTATGHSVVLPNATTLTVGWRFEFFNSSSAPIQVKYAGGTLLAALLPASFGSLTLESNGTTAGTWLRWGAYTGGTASGILHFDLSSDTPYTLSTGTLDTLITGMTVTPSQGEYALTYQGSIEITGNNTNVRTTMYAGTGVGGLLVPGSLRTIRSSVSTFFTTHITSAVYTFDGTTPLEVRVSRDSNTLTILSRNFYMSRLGDG